MRFINILFLVLFHANAFAAIAGTTVVEIRSSASSANINGGGFNPSNASPGTDYSMQDGSQFSGTNLVSTNATTNPCVVTSATHNFVASDNGNIIYIRAGTSWTLNRFEIVSTAGNAATLDRACGSVASISGGTWALGGALSMQNANDGTTIAMFAGSGTQYWVKAGTYTITAAWSVQTAGTAARMGRFSGYSGTRGDNPTGTSRPLIKWTSALIGLNAPAYYIIENVSVNGPSTNASFGSLGIGGNSRVINCRVINTTTTVDIPASAPAAWSTMINNEFVSYSGYAVNASSSSGLQFYGNYFHDSNYGIFSNYTGAQLNYILIGNIFGPAKTAAISFGAAPNGAGQYLFNNNTFYGGETVTTGIGISLPGTSQLALLAYNNIFYGLTTAISIGANLNGNWEDYNSFFNNGTNRTLIDTGSHSVARNPGFASVGQYVNVGTVTTSGSTLTDTGAAFTNVVPLRDFLYVRTSTGGTVGIYGITGNTSTTLTTDNALGTGSAVTYSIIWGHNYAVSPTMKGIAFPATGNPATTTYGTIGAAQRHEYGKR